MTEREIVCPYCGCKGKKTPHTLLPWIYPSAEHPDCGYPGPAALRLTDLSNEQMTMLITWRSRDEQMAVLGMVED